MQGELWGLSQKLDKPFWLRSAREKYDSLIFASAAAAAWFKNAVLGVIGEECGKPNNIPTIFGNGL